MIKYYRKSCDPSRKALLCDYIRHFIWKSLFCLQNCAAMVDYVIYSVILTSLDYYLPMVAVTKCSTDQPWVTPSFRNLVKSRQRAFLAGDLVLYHCLSNRTQSMANKLRKNILKLKLNSCMLRIHTSGGPKPNVF